jgi:hypothetical protein
MSPRYYWQDGMGFTLSSTRFSASTVQLCHRIAWLFGARFSATKTQVCHRLAFLGPCFQSARFNFVIESPGFLGPGFQPRRLRFVIGSPFWGRVFSRHGSTLSSNRLAFWGQVFSHEDSGLSSARFFGAVFSVGTVQLCSRIALPFWGQVFSRHGSTLSSNRLAFWGQVFSHEDSSLSSARLFGAVFSVGTVQLCRRIAILGLVPDRESFHTTSANRFRLLSRVSTQAAFV